MAKGQQSAQNEDCWIFQPEGCVPEKKDASLEGQEGSGETFILFVSHQLLMKLALYPTNMLYVVPAILIFIICHKTCLILL